MSIIHCGPGTVMLIGACAHAQDGDEGNDVVIGDDLIGVTLVEYFRIPALQLALKDAWDQVRANPAMEL
jgi:hypothetical protein